MPITRARYTSQDTANPQSSPRFFKSLFGSISQLLQTNKPRRRRASRQTAAAAEVLELRTMLTSPAFVAPASATVTDGATAFIGGNGISITDTAGGTEQLSMAVQHGTLTFGSTNGLNVSGNGTGTVLLSGTVSDINTALATLNYHTAAGFTGSDNLGMYVLNSSNNLSGNAAVSLSAATVPTISLPTSLSVAQNGTLNLSGANVINVSDTGGTAEQLTLSAQHGTLSLGSTTGLTVTGNGTGSVMLSGSLSNLNTALASLSYSPTLGFTGADTISVSNLDTTTNLTGTGNIGITVGAGTTSPTFTAPTSVNVSGGIAAFTGANAISINDTAGGTEQLSMAVQNGKLSLASTSGVTVSGNNSGTLLISGTASAVNAALAGLTYTANAGFTGTDSLGMYVLNSSDNLSANAAVSLSAQHVPAITSPGSISVAQNGSVAFTSGNAISVSDSGGTAEQMTLGVQHGTLTLGTTTGLTVTGNGTGSVTLTGSLSNLNAALASLSYSPTASFTGADTLTLSNKDTSTNLTGNASVAITVGTSTAPTFTAPTTVAVTGGAAAFTGVNAIHITDTAGGTEQLSLAVQNGSLTFGSTTGLTVSGNGGAVVLLSGSVANINAALATLTYRPNDGFSGTDHLGMYVLNSSDNLSANAGVALTDVSVPSITLPASVAVAQNGSLPFTAGNLISVSDSGGTAEQLTLGVSHGTLTLGTTTGLTVTGNGTGSVVVTGSLANLNAALATLVYTPTASFTGADTLTLSNLDTSTNLTGTGHVSIAVGGSISAPQLTVPASVTISGGTVAFTGANAISLTDTAGGTEQVSMAVHNGTLSLASTSGVTVSGNGTGTLLISGNAAAVNAVLAGLTYTASAGSTGSDNLGIYVLNSSSNLSTNAGIALSAANLPTITSPISVSVAQNGTLGFTSGNAISVADTGGTAEQLTLGVQHGTLSLGSTTGLTVTGNGTGNVVLTGSLANLNAALATLSYSPTASFNGSDTLTLSNLDTTTNLTGTSHVNITVGTGATAPLFTAPSSVSVSGSTAAGFTGVNAISITDTAGGTEQLSMAVQHGTLNLANTTGVSVSGTGTGTLLISGTTAAVNAVLAGLTYTANAGFTGTDHLGMYVLNSSDNLSANTGVSMVVS